MCLGIPGKVVETYYEHDILMGKVQFGGVFKRVCLEHVLEARIDDYVLVHVGFALSRIDEDEARQVFEFLERMRQLDELGGGDEEGYRSEEIQARPRDAGPTGSPSSVSSPFS